MGTEQKPTQSTSTNETSKPFGFARIAHNVSEWIFPLWFLYLCLLFAASIFDIVTGGSISEIFPRLLAAIVGLYVALAGFSDEDMGRHNENTHALRSWPLLRADGERRQVGGLVYSVGAALLILFLLGGMGGSGGGAPGTTPAMVTPTPTTTAVETYDGGYDEDGEGEDDDDVHVRPGSGGSGDSSDGGDYDDDYGGDYGDGDAGPDVDVGGGGVNIDWI